MEAVCCFCAEGLDSEDDEVWEVGVQRPGSAATQGWYAHQGCLANALNPEALFAPEALGPD